MQPVGRRERNKDAQSKRRGRSLRRFSGMERLPEFGAEEGERSHDEDVRLAGLPASEMLKTHVDQALFPPVAKYELPPERFRPDFANPGNRHAGLLGNL